MSVNQPDKVALNLAILAVSDTRNPNNDTSGQYLADAISQAGHQLVERAISMDDRYQIRKHLSDWIASDSIQVILITGGTGFAQRDVTPEAVTPLLDKVVDGFGELFRQLSHLEIGTSTIQSRALAGFANQTLVFCLPGSTGACRTAWESIIEPQLDSRHRPCHFVNHLKN